MDFHSHIQSGATAPLPLVWRQQAAVDFLKPSRTILDKLAPVVLKHGGEIQRLSTERIGAILAGEVTKTYGPQSFLRELKEYRGEADFYTPAIIMPMDMDFAHIAGFPPTSVMIYHEGKIEKWITSEPDVPPVHVSYDGVYYYDRKNGLDPENKGTLVDVTSERPDRVWIYQHYKQQHDSTVAAAAGNPWSLVPMFHYDPRRWHNPTGGPTDLENWTYGSWDFPFGYVASPSQPGIFIGFKMYPPLGYKPLDPRLPHLDEFYGKCEKDGIPILVHCSPGGMTTHEAEYYYQFDKADLTIPPRRIVSCGYDPCTPLGYFYDNYVHPRNWRPVLTKYPKLKLCLAHYGGDEWEKVGMASDWIEEITRLTKQFANVYTDMSCFNLANSDVRNNVGEFLREILNGDSQYHHLQDKLLFGVDWYLTLLTDGRTEYAEFATQFFIAMANVDENQWYRSTMINPATFYGLDNQDMLKSMNTALTQASDGRGQHVTLALSKNFQKVQTIKDRIAKLRKNIEADKK